jgi:SET domain-containing protein
MPSKTQQSSTRRKTKSTKRTRTAAAKASAPVRPYVVRRSHIHGRGVFAARTIRKGTDIIEYRGERITMKEADRRPDSDPDNPYHTFLFELDDGRVIDAAVRGNAARWINHSCAPNCEPYEDDEGRVFIAAKRTIRKGEELAYDHRLNVDGYVSTKMREAFACHCGAPRCRGTMLGRKRR